ncbi:BQ2448_3841 [Microbotryum intermedium]|uniref:BQ2448_3841 protein n=1 Tax=Microbotryum intermedium TaxID=269621 RepID=A0A238FK89_9BASI|nr:BQ2448_3841 [Microbotryum intermedium]
MAIAFSSPIPFPTTLPLPTQLSILTQLKHALIGHHARKVVVLGHTGALEQLVRIIDGRLRSETWGEELELVNEAATLLGTLSLPTQQAQHALLTHRVHTTLLSALVHVTSERPSSASSSSLSPVAASSSHDKLVEGVLRSIKVVYSDLVQLVGPSEWGDALISLIPVNKRNQCSPDESDDDDDDDIEEDPDDQSMHVDGATPTQHSRASKTSLKRLARMAITDLYSPTSSALIGLASLLDFDPSLDPHSLRLRHKRAELVCSLFSSTVRTQQQREAIFHSGTTPSKLWNSLVGIVSTTTGRVQESAIAAISALFKNEGYTMKACIGPHGGSPLFSTLNVLSQSSNSSRRLTATIARIVLWQTRRVALTFSDPAFDMAAADELSLESVAAHLVAMVDEDEKLRGRACFTLAYLTAHHLTLEAYGASNSRVLEVLKKVFEPTPSPTTRTPLLNAAYYEAPPNSTPIEAALTLIALLTAESEELRQNVKDKGLIPFIVQYLLHPSTNIRAAACHALRSLSRSVNLLRTILVEPDTAKPLVALLRKGEDDIVRITAVATVTNLLLEFSPLRATLVEEGVIEEIVRMTREGLGQKKGGGVSKKKRYELRVVDALWALKNASYQASYKFKIRLLGLLQWPHFRSFLSSPNPDILVQAFAILRNLTCTNGSNSTPPLFNPATLVEGGKLIMPREVVELIANTLSKNRQSVEQPGTKDGGVALQALYSLVNLAAGDVQVREMVMVQGGLMESLFIGLDLQKSRHSEIRCAAVWVFINLCQPIPTNSTSTSARVPKSSSNTTLHPGSGVPDLSSPPTTAEMVRHLRSLGVHHKLREMNADESLDVRERVKDALQGFTWD